MAFGLRIHNPIGELVLSDETYFPVYLGKATVVSTAQPSAAGDATTGTGLGGFSTLTFSYAGKILPMLALPPGFMGAVYSCTQSGSTWTMRASYTDGSQITDAASPANGMYVQAAPEVFVFGFPLALGGNWGGAIYNAAGQLIGDLSRRPLIIRQRVVLPANAGSVSVLSLTKPGVCGRAVDVDMSSVNTGVPGTFRVLIRNSVFSISAGVLTRQWDRRKLYNTADLSGDLQRRDAVNVWLAECAGLA